MNITDYLMRFYIEQNGETITPELAEGLASSIAVTDGSGRNDGKKWSLAECKEIGDELHIDWSSILIPEWFLVMNMMYSDYGEIFKKRGMTDPLIFGEMARAWFEDADAKPNKTFKYFFNS